MDTDSFIVHIKTEDIAKDAEARFDFLNYELNRPLSKGKDKKLIGVMEDQLGGKIIKEFVGLRAKTYIYLIDDGSKDKKSKGTKKFLIKRKLKFQHYKSGLETTQLENKIKYLNKDKIDVDSLKKIIKNSLKNNKLILKT